MNNSSNTEKEHDELMEFHNIPSKINKSNSKIHEEHNYLHIHEMDYEKTNLGYHEDYSPLDRRR
jgi:hypothetical protein